MTREGRLTEFVRNRPVTAFLLITFLVSYPLGITFNFIVSPVLAESSLIGLYLPRVLTVFGPGIAACLVANSGGGVIPLRALMHACRVPRRYFPAAIAILATPLVVTCVAFIAAGVASSQLLGWLRSGVSLFAAHVFIQCAVIGLGEEVGWRGWLLPSLARQRSFAIAMVLTGVAWITQEE